jgi:hypothetical protein
MSIRVAGLESSFYFKYRGGFFTDGRAKYGAAVTTRILRAEHATPAKVKNQFNILFT